MEVELINLLVRVVEEKLRKRPNVWFEKLNGGNWASLRLHTKRGKAA